MKTILVIDDEVFTREHLGKIIERKGFKVLVSATGEDGLEVFKNHRPDFVFLDIMLPGIDGEAVFGYIKEMEPAANIFFMTGSDGVFNGDKAQEMGASGYLNKPVFIDDIVRLLDILESGKKFEFFNPVRKAGD